jgi:hypothetical protein
VLSPAITSALTQSAARNSVGSDASSIVTSSGCPKVVALMSRAKPRPQLGNDTRQTRTPVAMVVVVLRMLGM